MALSLLHPGVYIEEVPSGVRTIQGVATSIALFVGWAAKGSTTKATRITSFSEYEREFGGLDKRTPLGHAVMHFFANGGSDAYVARLVPTGTGAPASASVSFGANLKFDATSPGNWAESFRVRVTPRTDPADPTCFGVEILDPAGVVVESFPNLSMDASKPRFPTNVINGRSAIVTVTAQNSSTALTANTQPLANGDDGTVLVPGTAAFGTEVLAKFQTSTELTDAIPLFNLVCAPGETLVSTLQILQKLCHDRRAFLIMDSAPDLTVTQMEGLNTALRGVHALNSAVFYPWVQAPDPAAGGTITEFPPSGFVAGVFARTDAARGVWKAPAGSEASLVGAVGLERTLGDADNGRLNKIGINCLRTLPIYGNVVWGARTLHGENDRGSEWKYVPVRRLALFIEESLFRGTQWVVFEPNDEPLWAQIRLNVGAFMNDLFRQGAFQGKSPREAYFVRCDRTTTTQNDINSGIVNILVGFAPLKPAEFVVLRIQQIAGEIAT